MTKPADKARNQVKVWQMSLNILTEARDRKTNIAELKELTAKITYHQRAINAFKKEFKI